MKAAGLATRSSQPDQPSPSVVVLAALVAQVRLDATQSSYWQERWSSNDHAAEIKSWLESLIDFGWEAPVGKGS